MELKHFSHIHGLVSHHIPPPVPAASHDHHHPQQYSYYSCSGCNSPASGDVYVCWKCSYFLHDQCFRAPRSLNHHPSHPLHPLTLYPFPTYPSASFICNSCHLPGNAFSYACSACDFDIHLHCALGGGHHQLPLYPNHHPHPIPNNNIPNPNPPNFNSQPQPQVYPPPPPPPGQAYLLPNNHHHTNNNYPYQNALFYPPPAAAAVPPPVSNTSTITTPSPPNYNNAPPSIPLTTTAASLQTQPPPQNYNNNNIVPPPPPPPPYQQLNPTTCTLPQNPIPQPHPTPPNPTIPTYSTVVNAAAATDQLVSQPAAPPPKPSSPSSSLIKHFSHPHVLKAMEIDKTNAKVCSACEYELSGSAYCCTDSHCTFNLHKSCFDSPLEVKHDSHLQHPLKLLTAPPYKDGFTCNACLKDGKAFAYTCEACSYDLHIDCIQWPDTVIRPDHKHPLALYYSSPAAAEAEQSQEVTFMCDVCKNPVHEMAWLYYCRECNFGTHLECIASGVKPESGGGSGAKTEDELIEEMELKFAVLQLLLGGGLTISTPGEMGSKS